MQHDAVFDVFQLNDWVLGRTLEKEVWLASTKWFC